VASVVSVGNSLLAKSILRFGSDAQKQERLPGLASGDSIGCFALAEGGGQGNADTLASTLEGGRLRGGKQPVLDGDIANFAVVVAKNGGGFDLGIVDLEGEGVERKSLKSFDPSRSVASLQFDDAAFQTLGEPGRGWEQAQHILDRAAVLLAFEQVGGAERTLEITREFVLGRYAFGRPVASFQAVKHRLADLWCEIELARSNTYYGAWALSNEESDLDIAACVSRIQASHAFDLSTVEMIELHGGVGYTWEYDCHLFYRRSKLLSTTLGSIASWKDKLVTRIEAGEAA
jgi:alkylation response protein AidB-like acyl-CoA dehydrogenase